MLPVLDPLVEHARLANIQDEFLQSKNFESVDCLALTLEEMVHIRRVLTKADLEDLPLDASVKDEIANGKVRVCLLTSRHCRVSSGSELSNDAPLALPWQVCFVCLKTRFAFFGPSGHRCKLCMQVVCAKCCSKVT
jgi:spire